MSISDCRRISLPKIGDERGLLTFVEEPRHIPFAIQRVFYMYSIPSGQPRGRHAHKTLEQVVIAIAGNFEVSLYDGAETETVTLSSPSEGLYVPKMTWKEMKNFSPEAICLVLASAPYDEDDYIRDIDDFRNAVSQRADG